MTSKRLGSPGRDSKRSAAVAGPLERDVRHLPGAPLGGLKKKFDLHGIEREDDPPIVYAVQYPGVQ